MGAMSPPVGRTRRRVQAAKWIALTALLIGLPFAGVALSGKPLEPYLEFPPKAIGEKPGELALSAIAFAAYSLFVGVCTLPVLWRLATTKVDRSTAPARGRFPWWG